MLHNKHNLLCNLMLDRLMCLYILMFGGEVSVLGFFARSACVTGIASCCYVQAQATQEVRGLSKRYRDNVSADSVKKNIEALGLAFKAVAITGISLIPGLAAGTLSLTYFGVDKIESLANSRHDLANMQIQPSLLGRPSTTSVESGLCHLIKQANKVSVPVGRLLFPLVIASTALNLAIQIKNIEDMDKKI